MRPSAQQHNSNLVRHTLSIPQNSGQIQTTAPAVTRNIFLEIAPRKLILSPEYHQNSIHLLNRRSSGFINDLKNHAKTAVAMLVDLVGDWSFSPNGQTPRLTDKGFSTPTKRPLRWMGTTAGRT
jgi:hypothetical protein